MMESRFLERGGCRLAYRLQGEGPPVLMIQGVGVQGDGWLPQVDALKDNFQCLTFDNRGLCGSAPAGPERVSIELMVEDALALADAQGWEKFHLVGHSMGGHISLGLALRAPGRVLSLALMCASARGRELPPWTAALIWTQIRTKFGPKRSRRHAFLELTLPRSMRHPEDLDNWAQKMALIFGYDLADPPAVVFQQLRAYSAFNPGDGLAGLAGIPSLVVSAEEDPLAPPSLGRRLAQSLPGSRYHEVAGASHGVTVTHPEIINQRLAEHWLGRTARS